MEFRTKTSVYKLEKIFSQYFLTKKSIFKGKDSMVEPGITYAGTEVEVIKGLFYFYNKPTGQYIRTSPVNKFDLVILNNWLAENK